MNLFPINSLVDSSIDLAASENEIYAKIKEHFTDIENQESQILDSLRNRRSRYDENSKIRGMQLNVAYACNMKCRYCFADDGAHQKSGCLSNKIMDYVTAFIERNKADTVLIHLVGGEPLVDFPSFKNMVLKLEKKMKQQVRFTTTVNGTLFNEEILAFFNDHNIDYMVSLDSYKKDIHDYLRQTKNGSSSYDRIMHDFMAYKDKYRYNSFHITVTPFNINFSETVQALYDLGAYHINIDFVKSNEKEFLFDNDKINVIREECKKVEEIILTYIREKREISCHPILTRIGRIHNKKPIIKRCGVYNSLFACDSFGDIFPCDMLMWEKYKLGNIYTGIDLDIRMQLMNDSIVNESCATCWARFLCGGVCAADKLLYSDQMFMLCELKKILMETRIRLYIRIREEHLDFNFDKYM